MRLNGILVFVFVIFLFIQPVNAQTWETIKRLTWNSEQSSNPAIAVDSSNHIHVVLNQESLINTDIFYKRSSNDGASWTTKRLTWNTGNSSHPVIALNSSSHIHVVWHDNTPGNDEIYYKRSTDGGNSWTTKRLTWNTADSRDPAIALDSDNHIHVVWHDNTPGNYEIYYKRSTDGGNSWTIKRLTWNNEYSGEPAIAVDSSGHIHVVWYDHSHGNYEIYYKRSTDGGNSWTTKRLTWNIENSFHPTVAVGSDNHIHVVWYDFNPGNYEIYYKRSTDGGNSWTTKRLTWSTEFSWFPAIAVDSSSHIHVVWQDHIAANKEIYYKRSTDGGNSWTTKRLTWSVGHSWSPTIAVGSDYHIHVVWQDITPGNWEIYYRKGIQ